MDFTEDSGEYGFAVKFAREIDREGARSFGSERNGVERKRINARRIFRRAKSSGIPRAFYRARCTTRIERIRERRPAPD